MRFRGKLKVDANLCTACATCEEVCPSGAIHITEDESSFIHTTWYNTCCFCANCEFFCPTGAIKLTNDYHTVNLQEDKYKFITKAIIKKIECKMCGEKFVKPSISLLKKSYPHISDNIEELANFCPECRKKVAFERLHLCL
ncbi:hydrogenase [Caminibacter mediatlanticus TB-2]|uniref:Hydrogenase n=1 Tax=Caminibacter mediatlanticus TB-2 TaxID=391592 RepID=A0AAI9AIT6_9BACT|nr:4Fe-4S dicluster domain-containing protein [Caminibacter mediatlanticus]EDM24284.1 carbon monoxide-induced hydrogenase, iron-sulfur cluster-binding subunit [Caminibacter mediatlanticus TB-2]QCT94930.1 hydrogenase [Caminibacter mediatlanticus TB-2]